MSKDYLITFTVKNNVMLKAMKENGFMTAVSLSKAAEVSINAVSEYLSLRSIPFSKRKQEEFKETIIKISKVLKRLPEDLFPEQHLKKALNKNKATIEMSTQDVSKILEYKKNPQDLIEFKEGKNDLKIKIKRLLETLSEREQLVLKHRFGLGGIATKTLEQITEVVGVSRERVRQIEAKALRRLRHPSRTKNLREHLEISN